MKVAKISSYKMVKTRLLTASMPFLVVSVIVSSTALEMNS